ncbi:glycosyltransferase family 1 protein [Hathewaya histolytica]|uniref:Glycosyltransferase n=1 Tax=Hathewaya histolytica TaxID=1498 RepID=A0A4U9RYK6_HATHI|nr:glycosyltransferase family 1 protein [Hathewaya histolytica]VTQ94300.1 glycosyltransferase [Hathewaya histolytica]
MKIAIDCRGINWYHGTGIGTYTDNLLKNLLKIDDENYYHLFWSGLGYEKYEKYNANFIMSSEKHHRFFQQHIFPNNIENEKIDIYHVPQNGIGLSNNIDCIKFVTVHDLIPYVMPETVGKGYLNKFLKEMPYIIENSDGILTVSEFSKKDILRFFPVDENKIFVTPLAANKIFKPLDPLYCKNYIKEKYNITNKFAMYVGGFSDRKNVHSLIEAFSKAYKNLDEKFNLFIIGSYRDPNQKLVRLAESLGMGEKIIFTGFIPEEELPIFYNAASVFIYPSFYEGFGLPPLEAMSCGTPVISSNLSSIPEVVKGNGILINPHIKKDLEYSIENVLNNKNLRESLRKKSLEGSKEFSWKNTAELTLESYNKIYNKMI